MLSLPSLHQMKYVQNLNHVQLALKQALKTTVNTENTHSFIYLAIFICHSNSWSTHLVYKRNSIIPACARHPAPGAKWKIHW